MKHFFGTDDVRLADPMWLLLRLGHHYMEMGEFWRGQKTLMTISKLGVLAVLRFELLFPFVAIRRFVVGMLRKRGYMRRSALLESERVREKTRQGERMQESRNI